MKNYKLYIFILLLILCNCNLFSKSQVNLTCDFMNTTFLDSEVYITELIGNVVLISDNYVIKADKGYINHKTNIIDFENNIQIQGEKFTISSDIGNIDYKNNTAIIKKNVHITTNNYTINADQTSIDKSKIATITGNVNMEEDGFNMNSLSMQVNLNTEEISSNDTYLCLNPKISKGYLDENLYIRVRKLNKGNNKKKYKLYECDVTGCDKDDPHYHLFTKEMDIITDKRIIFNNVILYFNHNKIISLDKYVLPLDARYNDDRVIPKFGISSDEGYYAKFFYPYNPKNEDLYGRFIIDLMTKKGLGLGIKQDYNFDFSNNSSASINNKYNINGDFSFYKQFSFNSSKGNEEFNINHNQKLGKFGLNFRLDGNNNFYKDEEDYKFMSFNPIINYFTEKTNTIFGYKYSKTSTSYKTVRENYYLNQNVNFNKNYVFNLSMNLDKYSADSYDTKKLSTLAYLKGKETTLDWKIFTQLYDDLGDNKNYSQGIEKKPEITLSSDFTRLNILKNNDFNILLNTSYSKLSLTNGTNIDRTYFDMTVPAYTIKLHKNLDFNADFRYKQYYYKRDMAKYALSSSPTLKYKINKFNTLSIDYNFQNTDGYSPVSSDNLASYRYSNFKWKYDNNNDLDMELYSGYDFMLSDAPWQNLYYKVKWKVNNNLGTYLSACYDLNEKKFGTLLSQFKYENKGNGFELGARYNAKDSILSSAKALFKINLFKDFYFRGYTSYDGIEKQFEYFAGEIMHKYHCYNTSLVFKHQNGYYKDTSIMFYIKLNILPDTDEFISGQNGQAISSDVGNLYY